MREKPASSILKKMIKFIWLDESEKDEKSSSSTERGNTVVSTKRFIK